MNRLSIVVVGMLAGVSLTASGQAPVVVPPVSYAPIAVVESPAFATLVGEPLPFVDRHEQEDPDKADLIANLGTGAAPTLVTPASHTTFQTSLSGALPVTVLKNFTGLGNGWPNWTIQGLYPPDTTMAVGPTQIVQWVNIRLSVMDKNGVPWMGFGGANGYINGNQIWSALPATSRCRLSNQGDPLVAYDRIANRWVLSQFAWTNINTGPFSECIAVSTTGDATGTYTLYEYSFANLPDYSKIGVWPDAYYITFNNFAPPALSFAGASTCAFDRVKMVAGDPTASGICFNYTNAQQFFSILPADFDGGTLPPAGSPNYQVSPQWFFANNPPYSVQLQKFHVDFVTPGNSTLTDGIGGPAGSYITMPIPDVIGACGDNGGSCVAQPGTAVPLDTSSMRMMYPLKYRNRGGVESLVVTQTIDPPGSATAGMNWMEIRNPGANPPVIRQNGALNPPDGVNRWMGSANMDKQGNIAMGYSASSAAVSPSIRIAGRLNADIPSRVRGELDVKTGVGNQTGSARRWGDYSTMQVDPTDDCTFWYTTEYTNVSSPVNWATQIIAFKFNNCN